MAAVDYRRLVVFIKWIGTHRDYDRIDVAEVKHAGKTDKNCADLDRTLQEVERLWGAPAGTPQGDKLDVLIALAEAYEREHVPIDSPDPIDAIKFRLEQEGKDCRSLIGVLGHRTRVYEVKRRDRPLSLAMIRRLHKTLRIPADMLLHPVRLRTSRKAKKNGRTGIPITKAKSKTA